MPIPTRSRELFAASYVINLTSPSALKMAYGRPSSSSPAQISDRCVGLALDSYMCTVGFELLVLVTG